MFFFISHCTCCGECLVSHGQARLTAADSFLRAHPQLLAMPQWPRVDMLESVQYGSCSSDRHAVAVSMGDTDCIGGSGSGSNSGSSSNNAPSSPSGVPPFIGVPPPIDLLTLYTQGQSQNQQASDDLGKPVTTSFVGLSTTLTGAKADPASLVSLAVQKQIGILQSAARDMDAFHVMSSIAEVADTRCVCLNY
jgi:hypothetical protein